MVLVSAVVSFPAHATEETQKALDAAREAASQTQEAIDANQDSLDQLGETKDQLSGQLNGFQSRLNTLSSQLAALRAQVADKQSEVDAKQDEIADKESEIQETNQKIEKASDQLEEAVQAQKAQYAAMKKYCQFLYENGQTYYLEILLTSDSYSDFLNRQSYIQALSAYNERQLEGYKQLAAEISSQKSELEKQKDLLEQEQQELQAQKSELASQQSELKGLQDDTSSAADQVSSLVSQTAASLNTTNSQISSAEDAADALQDQLDSQNAEVSALEKKLAEEKALQARSDASVWRDLSQVTFADGDEYLLANLIYCEAGGEPYNGQVAVGAVVMNRVMSGAFPDTVSGVIYQSGQFEPASTGRLAVALANDKATDSCYQAARAAMGGQTPVGNCLFFRTPIPEVTPKYTIGGHIFY